MGADYYADLYIGVPVKREDFYTTEEVQEVLCNHPEAEGKKFCPECGLKEADRVKTSEKRTWEPRLWAFLEKESFEEDDVNPDLLVEWEVSIKGFQVIPITTDSYSHSDLWIFGKRISHISGSPGWGGDTNPHPLSLEGLEETRKKLSAVANELGFTAVPVLYNVNYCSV